MRSETQELQIWKFSGKDVVWGTVPCSNGEAVKPKISKMPEAEDGKKGKEATFWGQGRSDKKKSSRIILVCQREH